jgi:hypothetical protein
MKRGQRKTLWGGQRLRIFQIDDSLTMASQLNVVWDRSDLENKKVMSRTLFPEGVLYDPENHRYLTKNVNSYFGLINTLSTSYKENKKGINQSETNLSPLVASIELHSNQMWKDLREFYNLTGAFEKILKIKKAGL